MNPATKKRRCTFRRSPQPCDAKVLYIEADYTGVPMRREELVGHKGKAPDGKAKTRMAALGCVLTQHQLDDQGRPLRDYGSTTYLAGFESPSDFGIGLRHRTAARSPAARNGRRCKPSGMFWTEEGANAVMALRCLNAGNRLKTFRAHRHSNLAA